MSQEMLGDAVIWMLLFAGYMALLFICGVIAEFILPHISAAQRWLDSLPPDEDNYENEEDW